MSNISLGTLAISMSLWAADLGASRMSAPQPLEPAAAVTCASSAATPGDDADLEVVVCGKPLR